MTADAMPVVSVVMPFHRADEDMATAVIAVVNQIQEVKGRTELILACNRNDRTVRQSATVWTRYHGVSVVDASGEAGAGAARNAGAVHARGEMLAFTDADDCVQAGWLSAVHDVATAGVNFATGPIPRFRSTSDLPLVVGVPHRSPPRLLGYLPYAGGTNLAVNRSAFLSAGGFDTVFTAGEDVDLSWRLQRAGISLEFRSDMVVAARWRDSLIDTLRQYFRYGQADVDLFRAHRDHGSSRESVQQVVRAYGGVLLRLPLLWRPHVRHRWARQSGRRLGRLVGSLKSRTLFL